MSGKLQDQALPSKSRVDKAATNVVAFLRSLTGPSYDPLPDSVSQDFAVLHAWREAHAVPLATFRFDLVARARRLKEHILPAQRLKRMISMLAKVDRHDGMRLSQMQDIGGCRGVASSLGTVYRLRDSYGESGDFKIRDDYIARPKDDGYRGIHIVGTYRSEAAATDKYNGLHVEIQLRTRLQHVFGTAVETVDTFTRSALKSGIGDPNWLRFFALMGSEMARTESAPPVPGLPLYADDRRAELAHLAKHLQVRERLSGWTNAMSRLKPQETRDAVSLLLVLDLAKRTTAVQGFKTMEEGQRKLAEYEDRGSRDIDAVLVWVQNIEDLPKAYPNYYADTTAFIRELNAALA